MESAPLTLNVISISPPTLVPTDPQQPSSSPLPPTPAPLPPHPEGFTFSPSPNYAAPCGSITLGSTLRLRLQLQNTHLQRHAILGVRMMVEIQGPGGRYRLGEVIHQSLPPSGGGGPLDGERETEKEEQEQERAASQSETGENQTLPELGFGESIEIDVESEMKELGAKIVIVSAAWETLDGRRTLQRFLKFNVHPPLAIKTRIQTPSHPNTSLDCTKREQVYLEILMQNTSGEGMLLDKVILEPVQGLTSRAVDTFHGGDGDRGALPGEEKEQEKEKERETGRLGGIKGETLVPNDTRQYLFILSPSPCSEETEGVPRSTFPPSYAPGTILPLGRLDVSWISGPHHLAGRLQTSTLNRRVPVPNPSGVGGIKPARTPSNQGQGHGHGPLAPAPAGLESPIASSRALAASAVVSPTPRSGALIDKGEEQRKWEYDLTVVPFERRVAIEESCKITLRLAIRSVTTVKSEAEAEEQEKDEVAAPTPPRIGIQYLSCLPSKPPNNALPTPAPTPLQGSTPAQPYFALSPPSRQTTPFSPAPTPSSANTPTTAHSVSQARPYSPLTPSRTGTPLSSQLRQAVGSHIAPHLNFGLSSSSASLFGGINKDQPTQGLGLGLDLDSQPLSTSPEGSGTTFPPLPFVVPSTATATTTTTIGGVNKPLPSHSSNPVSQGSRAVIPTGQISHLGNSLFIPSAAITLRKVIENRGTTYSPSTSTQPQPGADDVIKWEGVCEYEIRLMALDEGLVGLGGVRVLEFVGDAEEVEGVERMREGSVGREWESLGDIWITA